MRATTKPLSASSPAPPARWPSRPSIDPEQRSAAGSRGNEFDTAHFEAWDLGLPDLSSEAFSDCGLCPRGHRFARSSFHKHIQASYSPLRIVAETNPCAFWNAAASKAITPAFSGKKPFQTRQITAVDVRETSLEKAKFILSASGITNVQLSKENLNEPSPALSTAIRCLTSFCVGLLYSFYDNRQSSGTRAARRLDFYGFSLSFAPSQEAAICRRVGPLSRSLFRRSR